jgi:hypothetical protein
MPDRPAIVIRRARPEESAVVGRLVSLGRARPLYGDVVLAVDDGQPVAAMSLADRRVVADPSQPTTEAVDLLRRLRAA